MPRPGGDCFQRLESLGAKRVEIEGPDLSKIAVRPARPARKHKKRVEHHLRMRQRHEAVRARPVNRTDGLLDILTFRYLPWMESLAGKVDRPGTVVLPAKLRRRLGIEEGSFVVGEEREGGILIRPATVLPVEIYSPQRRAEFLLNNGGEPHREQNAR